jgi:type IV secretory pathway VirB10-like protein
MLATAFARLTVGRAAPTLIQGALTRCALQQSLPSNIRALASEAIPTEPKPPRKPRAVKPKAEGTAEKATKAVKKTTKKAAKAVTPKKAKAPKKAPKPKPWEARDADGKLREYLLEGNDLLFAHLINLSKSHCLLLQNRGRLILMSSISVVEFPL